MFLAARLGHARTDARGEAERGNERNIFISFFARRGDAASLSMKHKLFKSTQQLFAGAKGQEGGKKKYHIRVQWKFRKFERTAKAGNKPGR